MLSLIVWSTMLVVLLLLPARAVAYAARRAGSPRGRFLVGLLAVLLANGSGPLSPCGRELG